MYVFVVFSHWITIAFRMRTGPFLRDIPLQLPTDAAHRLAWTGDPGCNPHPRCTNASWQECLQAANNLKFPLTDVAELQAWHGHQCLLF